MSELVLRTANLPLLKDLASFRVERIFRECYVFFESDGEL